jgi:hypothetical protein
MDRAEFLGRIDHNTPPLRATKVFSVDEFLVGNLVTTEIDSMVSSYQSDFSHTERATTSS